MIQVKRIHCIIRDQPGVAGIRLSHVASKLERQESNILFLPSDVLYIRHTHAIDETSALCKHVSCTLPHILCAMQYTSAVGILSDMPTRGHGLMHVVMHDSIANRLSYKGQQTARVPARINLECF
jgi:hypothetical protein